MVIERSFNATGHDAAGELHKAVQALGRGEPDLARKVLLKVLEKAPDWAQAHYYMGIASHTTGAIEAAIESFSNACTLAPKDPAVHMGLGIALHEHGEHEPAIRELEKACRLGPKVPAYWFNLGKALLSSRSHPGEAQRALNRVLELDPGHVLAHMALADAHILLGEVDAAAAHYREVLRRKPGHAKAWLGLADIKTRPMTPGDLADLERALHQAPAHSADRIALGFALARAQEDQGEFRAAFATLQSANSAKRATIDWNANAEHALVQRIEQTFARPLSADIDTKRGEEVIFILSLPRSGSTLVEQILASHPDVDGAGEITDLKRVIDAESQRRGQPFPDWVDQMNAQDWARLGRQYLDATKSLHGEGRRFTDKNLLNWKLAGAAHAMLPGARFVHVRRDAVETCLACYRQLFRAGNPFTYDLAEMADYYNDCERLCRHWKARFPRAWHELVYERLQDDPEREIHRLLAFCGLPEDPSCLQFHRTKRVVRTASAAQVRQPLRRDTARAQKFGPALDALRTRLAEPRS